MHCLFNYSCWRKVNKQLRCVSWSLPHDDLALTRAVGNVVAPFDQTSAWFLSAVLRELFPPRNALWYFFEHVSAWMHCLSTRVDEKSISNLFLWVSVLCFAKQKGAEPTMWRQWVVNLLEMSLFRSIAQVAWVLCCSALRELFPLWDDFSHLTGREVIKVSCTRYRLRFMAPIDPKLYAQNVLLQEQTTVWNRLLRILRASIVRAHTHRRVECFQKWSIQKSEHVFWLYVNARTQTMPKIQ